MQLFFSHFPGFYSLDQSLGKIDKYSLSQQTLMELLVKDFSDKTVFRYGNGDFQDFPGWFGVTIDMKCRVTKIDWGIEFQYDEFRFGEEEDPPMCGGSIDLRWLPSSLDSFSISHMKLSGSLQTACLPTGLMKLQVDDNEFVGPFRISTLPANIVNIIIAMNELSGSLDLPAIPQAVKSFNAQRNRFSGGLDFTSLPRNLEALLLNENTFSGKIILEFLPSSVKFLMLENNRFQQDRLVLSANLPNLHVLRIDPASFGEIVDSEGGMYVKVNAVNQKTEVKKVIPL